MKWSWIFLLLAALTAGDLAGQAEPVGQPVWNGERALELIRRAQERRSAAIADTGLVNFQADARLYVYFYLDRPDTRERNLVKTDQLALDVLWQAPDQVKQRIIGWRDRKSLPTNIHYHLDHLTVVLENFGDEIRLGDGDEVRNVPHPAAADVEEFYDYRLVDSLTLRLPGATEPVRVYEMEVRPRDPERPAFLGSLFVDQRAGDIVRMDFTFTRAAYIDRYLDYINISLDNGLWRGRSWLPNEQRVEIRRRIPGLDIPAGSVIRANMRVGNYRFNQPLPPQVFAGPAVVAAPRKQREAFPFEQELHAEVREEGIGPQAELGEIRRRAAALVREQALQRATGLRLRVPRFSEVLRYNRSEGLVLSAGVGFSPRPSLRLGAQGGYALGADHPVAAVTLGSRALTGSLYLNRPRDIGVGPVVSGAMNTVSSFFAGEDYLDLFYATGAEIGLERRLSPAWSLAAGIRAESHESAETEAEFSLFGGGFRQVRAVDDAYLFVGGSIGVRRESVAEAASGWSASASASGGIVNPVVRDVCKFEGGECRTPFQGQFLKPFTELGWGRRWLNREAELQVTGRAGLALGDVPRQELYLIGGRGTMPGYGFRAYGGERFATANATLAADIAPPWVRGRLLGALGWADGAATEASSRDRLGAAATNGPKPSVGIGIGIFHDIIQVDLARGLASDGRWELIVEANRSFWDFL